MKNSALRRLARKLGVTDDAMDEVLDEEDVKTDDLEARKVAVQKAFINICIEKMELVDSQQVLEALGAARDRQAGVSTREGQPVPTTSRMAEAEYMSEELKETVKQPKPSSYIVKLSERDYNYLIHMGPPPAHIYDKLNGRLREINTGVATGAPFKIEQLDIGGIHQWWVKTVGSEYRFFLRKMVSDFIEGKNLTGIKMPQVYAVICENNLSIGRDGHPIKDDVGETLMSNEIKRCLHNVSFQEYTGNLYTPRFFIKPDEWEVYDWSTEGEKLYRYDSEADFIKAFDELSVGDTGEKLGTKLKDEVGEYVEIDVYGTGDPDIIEKLRIFQVDDTTGRVTRDEKSFDIDNKYSNFILLEHQPVERELYARNVVLEMMYLLQTFGLDVGHQNSLINLRANQAGQCVILDCEIKYGNYEAVANFVYKFGPDSGSQSKYNQEDVGVVSAYFFLISILSGKVTFEQLSKYYDTNTRQIRENITFMDKNVITVIFNLDDLLRLSDFLTSRNLFHSEKEESTLQQLIKMFEDK